MLCVCESKERVGLHRGKHRTHFGLFLETILISSMNGEIRATETHVALNSETCFISWNVAHHDEIVFPPALSAGLLPSQELQLLTCQTFDQKKQKQTQQHNKLAFSMFVQTDMSRGSTSNPNRIQPALVSALSVGRNTQVRRNYTTPHKTQMIDTTINLLVNRTECTNLSGTTLTLIRDSEKLDATIKLSLTLPTHSCHCPHGRRNHVSPIIIFRNFINFDPCSGFVIKSPIISSVGQYFTFKFPSFT